MTNCSVCGKPLQQALQGPPRRFCSDRCRKRARVDASPATTVSTGAGPLRQAAEAGVAELRGQGLLTAQGEILAVALLSTATALDANPGSAALLHEFVGLQGRLEALGAAARPVEDYGERIRRIAPKDGGTDWAVSA
jgi:hypothetical protein